MNTPRAAVTIDATAPEPMGLASGGNAAKAGGGWTGTVHNLTAADKAANFRKSLDRQRAAANPASAAAKSVVDATLVGAKQATDQFKIEAFEPIKKPDRQGEWEDRITAMEAKVAAMSHFAREAQSPFKFVFLAKRTGGGWQEQTVNGTDIVDFEDGRKAPDADAPGQLLDPQGSIGVIEIRTGSNSAYVPLGGEGIWIAITGATQDGVNKRWLYEFHQVEKNTAGYDGWSAVPDPDGIAGPGPDYDYARNTVEDINSTGGMMGNGVDVDTLNSGFDIQAVPPIGVIVRAWLVYPATPNEDGTTEVWFSYENAIDGACE